MLLLSLVIWHLFWFTIFSIIVNETDYEFIQWAEQNKILSSVLFAVTLGIFWGVLLILIGTYVLIKEKGDEPNI